MTVTLLIVATVTLVARALVAGVAVWAALSGLRGARSPDRLLWGIASRHAVPLGVCDEPVA